MKNIIFLHHSTGRSIWVGKTNRLIYKLTKKGDLQKYLIAYNKRHKTDYQITEQSFPKNVLYGWNNYPFDYYNIWVKMPENLLLWRNQHLKFLQENMRSLLSNIVFR